MFLKDKANRNAQCWHAQPTIARETGLSISTVRRAISDLEKAGFLEKKQRWRPSGAKSSLLYTVK